MTAPYESATHFKKGSVARRTEARPAQRIYTFAASLDGLGMNLPRIHGRRTDDCPDGSALQGIPHA